METKWVVFSPNKKNSIRVSTHDIVTQENKARNIICDAISYSALQTKQLNYSSKKVTKSSFELLDFVRFCLSRCEQLYFKFFPWKSIVHTRQTITPVIYSIFIQLSIFTLQLLKYSKHDFVCGSQLSEIHSSFYFLLGANNFAWHS